MKRSIFFLLIVTLFISCEENVIGEISITPKDRIEVIGHESEFTVEVTANADWDHACAENWITVTKDGNVATVSVLANELKQPRSATVVFTTKTDNKATASLVVNQSVAAPDYIELALSGGIYLGDMMDPAYDNYTYYVATEGVTVDPATAVPSGDGTSLFFLDTWAPLGTGPNLPEGEYTVIVDETASKDFKFKPGSDYGDGMMQGAVIRNVTEGSEEIENIYITGGKFTVIKTSDSYRVVFDIVDENGEELFFSYEGALNILDPFAGMVISNKDLSFMFSDVYNNKISVVSDIVNGEKSYFKLIK